MEVSVSGKPSDAGHRYGPKAALLAPVRESLANNTPMVWHRVTDLPDYVYFNHKIHVANGVGCESCHGTVQDMPLTWKARTLTMGLCLDCHRDPGPNLRPPEAIFNKGWQRTPDTPSPLAGLTGCDKGALAAS